MRKFVNEDTTIISSWRNSTNDEFSFDPGEVGLVELESNVNKDNHSDDVVKSITRGGYIEKDLENALSLIRERRTNMVSADLTISIPKDRNTTCVAVPVEYIDGIQVIPCKIRGTVDFELNNGRLVKCTEEKVKNNLIKEFNKMKDTDVKSE